MTSNLVPVNAYFLIGCRCKRIFYDQYEMLPHLLPFVLYCNFRFKGMYGPIKGAQLDLI